MSGRHLLDLVVEVTEAYLNLTEEIGKLAQAIDGANDSSETG
jgi:hypothetical protein